MPPVLSPVLGSALGTLSAAAARARGTRPLHPTGAVLPGRLLRSGVVGEPSGIAWLDTGGADDVVVRLSRAAGLPPWCPDVHGLALRHEADGVVVDVLLSTTGTLPLARHVLVPHLRAGRGTQTSLLPYRGPRGPVLLAARPVPRRSLPPDPLAVTAALADAPLRYRLAWAEGAAGRWRPFGWLVVGGVPDHPPAAVAEPPVRFDPLSAPPGLATYPWAAEIRRRAYAAAREAVPAPRDAAVPARAGERS